MVKSLSEGVSEYRKLLEPYNHEVKNEIAFQCKREEIIKDDNQFNSVIPVFLKLQSTIQKL